MFLNTDYLEIFVGHFSHYREVCGMISGFCCGAVHGRSSEILRGVVGCWLDTVVSGITLWCNIQHHRRVKALGSSVQMS